jgi:CubicO group peptidase (beta-lactamase class C family)
VLRLRAVTAIALTLSVPAKASPVPSPSFTASLEAKTAQAQMPGVSVAVIKDYAVEWAAGFGFADEARRIKVTTDTLFQAASVSKPIAALAVMIALGNHGLSVDDDVNAILDRYPPAPPADAWRLDNPFPAKVTVKMLLAHVGGTNDFHYSGYRYGYDRSPPAPLEPLPLLADELIGRPPANTGAIKVVRPPGLGWVYSPAGYTVLQTMLTGLERRPFAEIMDDLVLGPLGLPKAGFAQPTPQAMTGRMATPYVAKDKPLADGPRVFIAAASGGLTATPTELAEIIIAIQEALAGRPHGPITNEIARAMMVRQDGEVPEGKCFPAAEPGEKACRSSWGLGFDVNLTKTFEHEADERPTGGWFGHSGFNSGYLTLALGSKTGGQGVVTMANIAPEDMSGDVAQWGFMMWVAKRVAEEEGW